MAKGFFYLVAILDWYSRKVLSGRLSNRLDDDFCQKALREAISLYGSPEIFNSDQGRQFTSREFTGILEGHGIKISMDGKGSWLDHVMLEHLWHSSSSEHAHAMGSLMAMASQRCFVQREAYLAHDNKNSSCKYCYSINVFLWDKTVI